MSGPQFIRSPSGEEMVVISRAEYEALREAAAFDEDEADVALYDARKAEIEAERGGALLPPVVSAAMLRGDSLLRALRGWRGLTQIELAEKAGIGQGYLSDLESGRKSGAPETMRRLAEALDIPAHWVS